MATPLTDEELRRELRLLCNQGRLGPVQPSRAVAAVLVRHGLVEQVSGTVWIPTSLGRTWCNVDEALGPPVAQEDSKLCMPTRRKAEGRHGKTGEPA